MTDVSNRFRVASWREFVEHEQVYTPLGRVTVRRHIFHGWWDAHPVDDVALLRSLRHHDYPRGATPQAAVDALLGWVAARSESAAGDGVLGERSTSGAGGRSLSTLTERSPR